MPLFGGPPNIAKLLEKKDVAGLIKALGYPKDPGVRSAAAAALGQLRDPRAVEPLIAALDDLPVRCVAAEALGQIGDPRAVEPLAAFAGRGWLEHDRSIEALGAIGGPRAVELLVDDLMYPSAGMRKTAAEALDRLAWSPSSDEAAAAYWAAKRDVGKCASFGPAAVAPLALAAGDGDRHTREDAVAALGEIGDPRAVGPLIEALKEPKRYEYHDVPVAAVKALGLIGAPAVPPLIEALKDRNTYLRRGVAGALGTIGDPRAVEPLIAALDDGSPQLSSVRTTIIEALSAIGDPRDVEPLLVAMYDEHRETRQAAARALVAIYQSGKMSESQRTTVLAQREAITTSHGDRNYGCPMEHSDGGIGVDFPV